MARAIDVSVVIDAPIEEVWDEIQDLASHQEWMTDAESITFQTEQTSGVGTRMEVATKVGLFRLKDVMEFTAWEPPLRMAIRHEGLVSGFGEFRLRPFGDGTRFTWHERLEFPFYLGGPITAAFAAPVLGLIWKRNLERLKRRFE